MMHTVPGYYLLELTNGTVTSVDGAHDTKAGANKALHLYKRLGFYEEGSEYIVIKVLGHAKESSRGVNKEALNTMAGIMGRK